MKHRYLIYRPLFKVREKPHYARTWWRYAIKCILKANKERKTRINQFEVSPDLDKFYQTKFVEVFLNTHMKVGGVSELDQRIYERILNFYELKRINKWTYEALYQIEKNAQEEEQKKKKNAGLLGGIFSWGAKPEEKKVSIKDNVKQIFNLVTADIENGKLIEIKGDCSLIFAGEFEITKGRIKLYQKFSPTSKHTIEAQFDGLSLNVKKRNNGMQIDAKIKSVGLAGTSKPDGETLKFISNIWEKDGDYLILSVGIAEIDNTKKISVKLSTVFFLAA